MGCDAALLIIDMLNDFSFAGGERLLPGAQAAAGAIDGIRREARAAGVPVIYVNDNFGHWHSDRDALLARLMETDAPGAEIARRLAPEPDDLFVIKPRFSGFYATGLPVLLPTLGARRLILTGVAADICVLFTAADAHMREYPLWVPSDAVASEEDDRTRWALEIMRNSMDADTRATGELTLRDWLNGDR